MGPFFAEKNRVTDVRDVSADYTITENYGVLFVDASSADVTISVPSREIGRHYSVSKRDSTGNSVIIDFGGSLCNGFSTQVITTQYDTITFAAGKSDWGII